jgi:restriction system protein
MTAISGFHALQPRRLQTCGLRCRSTTPEQVDPQDVVRTVRALDKKLASGTDTAIAAPSELAQEDEWKQRLHAILTQQLAPAAFERLVQRLLREFGFTQVEVTGRSVDGGIDGRGIARIHGFMRFHVLFQCKRYKGAVPPSEIRDFRGTMVGRAANRFG